MRFVDFQDSSHRPPGRDFTGMLAWTTWRLMTDLRVGATVTRCLTRRLLLLLLLLLL